MKLIAIIGITGTQGASVADVFLQEPGWRIRGITRNVTKEASKCLEAKGIEMVAADLDDLPSLISAFQGAHAIFSVTDFWQPAKSSMTLLPDQRKSLSQFCHDLELQRGKNIAHAADSIPTLERFICSTTSHATKWSKGKYTHVKHFDSKAGLVEYIRESLPCLASKMSTLQLGLYATNWKFVPFTAPRKQSDGTYVLSLAANGNTPLPMIDTRKDTGHLVRALLQVLPGKTLLGFGSLISWTEYMRLWGEILGFPGSRYEQINVETAAKIAGVLGHEVAEGFAYMGEFGYDGGDPSVIHPKDLGVDCPTTSIESYIRNEDWSSILA
ncbi:hypothetical protein C0991_005541 [Blastosporella zonata]|nr:hypothetical protein C0991_005541 [Blastosporella zonata]